MEIKLNARVVLKEFEKDGKLRTYLYLIDAEKGDKIPIQIYATTPKEYGYKLNRLKEILGKE